MQVVSNEPSYDVGVIVGRFQVPELHKAHLDLIQHVCEQHSKVLMFLGLSPATPSKENPLDYEARKQMILADFPDIILSYIEDMNNDLVWSRYLDKHVRQLLSTSQRAVLYGGRDSFIARYHGKLPTRELKQDVWVSISGKEIRRDIARRVKADPAWRQGVVWATQNRFAQSYATVDIAVFNDDETELLMARKPTEDKYRFIGGFADPGSDSYEADARREFSEETGGAAITDPVYIASTRVDDWRYRSETDKIKTILFRAKHQFGNLIPSDDLEGGELRWMPILAIKSVLVETHAPLLGLVIIDLVSRNQKPKI